MSPPAPDFTPAKGEDARAVPVRLLVVQGEARPPVDATDEPVVMTFPHLLVRELIALLALSLGLVLLSIFFDAPLEEIANPEKTPNPAKAPWYFLGLQELLHYYPPVVSGVLLPVLAILALVVIPYFNVNLVRAPLWAAARWRKLGLLWLATAALFVLFHTTGAHPVWPVNGPLLAVAAVMSLPALLPARSGPLARLGRRSLPFWIFLWFLLTSVTLTVIGVYFRGPGWSFTLPWRDGIYY